MGKVITAKIPDREIDLLAWMDAQGESRNELILTALRNLKQQRETGTPQPAETPPPSPPSAGIDNKVMTRLCTVLERLDRTLASRPIYAGEPEEETAPPVSARDAILDDMLAGLEEWMQ